MGVSRCTIHATISTGMAEWIVTTITRTVLWSRGKGLEVLLGTLTVVAGREVELRHCHGEAPESHDA